MSGIYIPGRLQETDPVLFEAICIEMCLAHLGYKEREIEHISGKVRNPAATVFPYDTKEGDLCLGIRVRSEVYDKEIRVVGSDFDGKVAERGVGHVKEVECVIMVGPLKCTPEEMPHRRASAMAAFKAEIPSKSDKLFKSSRAWRNIEGIAKMLRLKGFEARR